jgi:hypothetical protein
MDFRAFLKKYDHNERQLVTKVAIGQPCRPGDACNGIMEYEALWDTGATHSSINPSAARECGLIPCGMGIVARPGKPGGEHTPFSMASLALRLPANDGVVFPNVFLVELECPEHDVLIGMDIISLGDFCLSNVGGEMWFSFRLPSIQRIDLTISPKPIAPCTCSHEETPYGDCCNNLARTTYLT